MSNPTALVQRLWNYCNILRDDGLSFCLRQSFGGQDGDLTSQARHLGATEAPFALADLPPGEDIELRIFIDKYLVEVFANDRQALLTEHGDYRGKPDLHAFSVGAPLTLQRVEIWKLKPTHQGFREAQKNRHWEPATK